jgi:CTP synthase
MPDVVVARTETQAPVSVAKKLSLFGGVAEENVLLMPNADTVYRVPLILANSGINRLLSEFTGLHNEPDLSAWKMIIRRQMSEPKHTVKVGLVAKYMDNEDTYISVIEALKAAAWHEKVGLDLRWINAETANEKDFKQVDAILVPGGFGNRGVEGKIAAARYALDNNVPYLGICLGLQVAVIASARKAGLKDANSTEFDLETKHDVVYIMEGQAGKESTGGTLRLGNYPAKLAKGSATANAYSSSDIIERHRHRYEVNQVFLPEIEKGGLAISGTSPDGKLVEFIEAPNNDYFVATQAHPEFRSRPMRPHPLFVGLIKAGKKNKEKI